MMGQNMKRLILAAISVLALTSGALAVSVGEIAGKCGDDAKAYCEGVGYGDAMTQCLAKHRKELKPECKIIVERIEGGERVSLF
jgi:hypothetical protein